MAYTLKSTNSAQVTTDSVNDTTTVVQGFLVWVLNYPATTVNAAVKAVINNSSTKTQAQIEAEVNVAVQGYITENFPA